MPHQRLEEDLGRVEARLCQVKHVNQLQGLKNDCMQWKGRSHIDWDFSYLLFAANEMSIDGVCTQISLDPHLPPLSLFLAAFISLPVLCVHAQTSLTPLCSNIYIYQCPRTSIGNGQLDCVYEQGGGPGVMAHSINGYVAGLMHTMVRQATSVRLWLGLLQESMPKELGLGLYR